jgi:hypothetical protein
MRQPISITLGADNVLWLKAQAAASEKGTVSDVVDRLIRAARDQGRLEPASLRSVVGTIDLPDDDPDLARADAYVRSVFDTSLARPMAVRERPAAYRTKGRRRG